MLPWTPAMVATLRRMRAAGCTDTEIGLALVLTAREVRQQRLALDIEEGMQEGWSNTMAAMRDARGETWR